MKAAVFPYLAVVLGLILMMIVTGGSSSGTEGGTAIPLLTLLVISEFAFFVTAIGAFLGIKHFHNVRQKPVYVAAIVICALLAIRFMWLGIELWPL